MPLAAGGGIMRYRDPSACLSRGAAALGYRHAGYLQLSHRRPPQMCGLRTRPRTDVNPPSISGSNCHRRGRISSCRPRGDTLLSFYLVVCPSVRPSQVGVLSKRIEVIFKTKAGADLGFYKGGCPIHLKGASPNSIDPCCRNQTIFWP